MDLDVLREAIKLAFDLPEDCPKLDALARQLDLLLMASDTGQDIDAAMCAFLARTGGGSPSRPLIPYAVV